MNHPPVHLEKHTRDSGVESTVEPPNKGHIGIRHSVPCGEVVLLLAVKMHYSYGEGVSLVERLSFSHLLPGRVCNGWFCESDK